MICYLDSKSDKKLKVCTMEKFIEMTKSARTAMLIDAYRSGENPDAKGQLPAFVFMGYPPEDLMGKDGSRKKSLLLPTGLVMLDYDHLSLTPQPPLPNARGSEKSNLTPQLLYDRLLKLMPKLGLTLEHDLALAHATPSGDGLRLVLRLPRGKQIAEYQQYISDKLGMECDKAVKDISRISFVPKYEDIFYINKALLFGEVAIDNNTTTKYPVRDNLCVAQGFNPGNTNEMDKPSPLGENSVIKETSPQGRGETRPTEIPGVETPRYKEDVPPAQSGAATSPSVTPYGATAEYGEDTGMSQNNRAASTTPSFPECYNGIPYTRIVEELIRVHGGKPQVGNRNNMVFMLAGDLCKITDYNQTWVESLVPTFGLPEEEWRATIAGQCKKVQDRGLSMKLKEAIRNCKGDTEQNSSNSLNSMTEKENLPPAMPANLPSLIRLLTSKVLPHQRPAVSAMIFPALATHVNNALFKLSDNTDVELSMMCCLLAPQSVGKGCVKPLLRAIMADIRAEDDINRQRERTWQEEQKNKKANEKGKSRPDDLVIRCLSSDTTPAAFLGRLFAAEHGNGTTPNLCTYSQVDEIEDLYSFCAGSGKNRVQQMIKRSWDRDDIGAERWTANAANIATVLRWNWAASSTIEGGRKFFRNCLTDGTTSRVDFCTIIAPDHVVDFCYGDYDEEFEKALQPYIDNLKNFSCAKTEGGRVIPVMFPEIRTIEEKMNAYINRNASTEPDSTWENYAWRAKVMAIKKLIVLYVANGCQWEPEFEDFIWWSFKYSMWCKLNLFYDRASAQFTDERLISQRGNRSPLKFMTRTFTLAEFAAKCQQMQTKQRAIDIIYKYKSRGVIVQNDDSTYTVTAEYAEKFGIK